MWCENVLGLPRRCKHSVALESDWSAFVTVCCRYTQICGLIILVNDLTLAFKQEYCCCHVSLPKSECVRIVLLYCADPEVFASFKFSSV